jgi:surface antigen
MATANDHRLRRWNSVLLTLVLALTVISGTTPAAAGTNDYPYQGAACWSTGGTSGSCANYDWRVNGGEWDPWGFGYRNCTSWVAWKMNHTNGIAFSNGMRGGRWGNANTWDDNAVALGYTVDASPVAGAIAQTDAGSYGHVAWVERVNTDGTVTLEDYNYGGTGAYAERTVPAGNYRYIHVQDLPSNAQPKGSFDEGTGGVGMVHVRGWAFDPDTAATQIHVHIYIGGPTGTGEGHDIGVANTYRPDVGAVYPGAGSYHGYDTWVWTGLTGAQSVYAYAIDASGGNNPLLGSKTVTIADASPVGHLDSAASTSGGTITVHGWAFDPSARTSPTSMHLYIGGPAGTAGAEAFDLGPAQSVRTDVAAAYPGVGNYHGMDTTVVTSKVGVQPVYLYGINLSGTPGSNALLGSGTVTVARPALASLSPSRVLDTRTGVGALKSLVSGGKSVDLVVAGRGGVPSSGVAAVVLNVTATSTIGAGFVTVFPTGAIRPTASSLNFAKAQTIANQVIAKVGAGGAVSLYTSAGAQLIADVAGYYPTGSGYVALSPTRILDTRTGTGAAKAKVAAGGTVPLTVTGIASVPTTAAAVVLNVTVTGPAGAGYVTAYPAGTSRPTASNVNYRAGQTIAGMVIAKVGASGKVNLYTSASAHLVADVVGWIPAGADYFALSPARVLDTRTGLGAPKGTVAGGHAITLKVTGHGGIPATGVKAVLVNVTVTGPTGSGYVTIYPGSTRPTASNLNYARGDTIANSVVAKVAPDGTITLYTSATTHLITDINGWWTN